VRAPATDLSDIASWIGEANRVVVLTGAGISTESGIPDFRGPQGVWTRNPEAEKMATLQHYLADRDIRVRAWRTRVDHEAWSAQPNAGHVALADLERKGKVHTLVTQNVDGLHQMAGSSPERIVEIHGTMREVMCMSCGERAPMERALDRVRAGEEDPPCRTCGGILKSATISFGQQLVHGDLERSWDAANGCDLFLAVGTSLVVYPVADLPRVALEAGARLIIVNAEETPYDRLAQAVLRDRIGEVLPQLVELV
jgi:NAD-dependent deacetylase